MFSNKDEFKLAFLERLERMHGKSFDQTSKQDQFQTLGTMVRESISGQWIQTNEQYRMNQEKQVYYLSIEFLLGRLLKQNLMNLGCLDVVEDGLRDLGIHLEEIDDMEDDAGLGNGGLGRLAACFLDSLASLAYPGHGMGIRYRHGLFEQRIVDGFQVELPEQWLKTGYVWEVRKSDLACNVPFWGSVEVKVENGKEIYRHVDAEYVSAVPHDMPVVGAGNETINTLRLWNAEPTTLRIPGNVLKYKRETEQITEFLYPDDTHDEGKILRLKQQYFLVSSSLQTIIKQFLTQHKDIKMLPRYVHIQINDTHPSLAVPELMRLLLDEHSLSWEEAYEITRTTLSYTNHTTLSEALEKWPEALFQRLLPRIYMIVKECNERFCQELWEKYPGDWSRIERMAIIAHDQIRMAHLAIYGSYRVNGVARLHTEILKHREMREFYEWSPEKFCNQTNGITHRRWLLKANPSLTKLLVENIGDDFIKNPSSLEKLHRFKEDTGVLQSLYNIKKDNKIALSNYYYKSTGQKINPDSIYDVQIKRLHAYKRQLLNVFHIFHLYQQLEENKSLTITPRTFIFGAKASPGYYFAKKVIKLIHSLQKKIQANPRIREMISIVFMENYRVSLAERIIPAADVSEQISTASKEASGTGNMKLMMNGALTIGTLDGANVEIAERVGSDNIYLFGLTSEEVMRYDQEGGYVSTDYYHHDSRIKNVMEALQSDFFGHEREQFDMIVDALMSHNDQYFVLRDFSSYVDTQKRLADDFQRDALQWQQKCLVNIAESGYFSSDRTIDSYAREIWGLTREVRV